MGIASVGAAAHFDGATGLALENDVQVGSYVTAYNGSYLYYHHNGRWAITTDAYGATRITVGGLSRIEAKANRLRLDVTGSDAAHKTNGSGGVALAEDGSGAIDVQLLPNTTYYVWIFCSGTSDRFYDTALTIAASGTYGTPAEPAAGDGSFGVPLPIRLAGGSAGGRDTLTASCAGHTETLLQDSAALSLTWTPALAVYAPLLPNAGSAQATLSCKTYYAGVLIGTRTKTLTLRFPESLAPTLSPGWAAAAYYNTGSAAAGIAAWVQGHSRAQVTFDSAKIACQYGASIAGYKIVCGGVTDTAPPYRTGVLAGTSAVVRCTVTDSRGLSRSEDLSLTLQPYATPKLSAIRIYRSDAAGNEDEDGTNIAVKATANIASLSGLNTAALRVYTKPVSGSYSDKGALSSGTRKLLSGYSPDQSCDVKIVLTDALGSTASCVRQLPTRVWAMKFRADGNGVAFGKAPDYNKALQIPADWQMRIGSNAVFLVPNTTPYTHSLPCFGWVTGSGKTVRLHFVSPYSLVRAQNVAVTAVSAVQVRHADGGYIGGGGSPDLSAYISTSARYGGTIRVDLVNEDGTPVLHQCYAHAPEGEG